MSAPRAAWTFLTRVPVGSAPIDAAAMSRAPAWFPAVGAVIGALAGAVYVAAFELVGATVAAALAVTFAVLVTGAFHHDGLADMADGFGGGWDRAQRLEIMKDSRHGTYGVMALVCTVLIHISALARHDQRQGFAILVVAHSCARAGAVVLMRAAPRAHGSGLGVDYATGLRRAGVIGATLSALVIGALVLGWTIAVVAGVTAVGIGAVAWLAWRKIGGITGDVLGAAEQVAETAIVVCGAALATQLERWPWWA